jgi:hypothetical protein
MHSLAATPTPVAAPAIPIEWITSGVVTPVGAPVTSPAAAVATTWAPQPVFADPLAGNGSYLDALRSSMYGAPAAGQQQLTMTAAPVAVAAPVAMAAPQMMPVSYQVVAAPPIAPVTAGAPTDPTLVGTVGSALAGFANATGRAVETVGAAVGAGTSRARRVGSELWAGVRSPRAVHVSQVPSKYNAAPAAGNRDCGPASVVMTLRLLGRNVPGAAGTATPQRLINRIRQLAGNAANTVATTNHELARALRAAGTRTREIADGASIRQAVLAGKPVILNGNPRHAGAYGPSFSSKQMTPYNGAHWIVVSGIDEKSGKFIVNDPLSKVGPVKVTAAQLEAYRGGSLGIEVTA